MKIVLVFVALVAVFSVSQVEAKGSKSEFEKAALTQHNFYRKRHRVPALTLDKNLTRRAQKWANQLARSDTLQHNPKNHEESIGENVYMSTGSVAGEDAVVAWYGEFRMYTNYNNDPSITGSPALKDIGHFTQVLWKNSKKVGVAEATSSSGRTYVVANYSPAGNVKGHYVENVLPAKDA